MVKRIYTIRTTHPEYVHIQNPLTEQQYNDLATELDNKFGAGECIVYSKAARQEYSSQDMNVPEYSFQWKGVASLLRSIPAETCPKCHETMYNNICRYCDI
jgi:hypothetical protein